MSVEEEFEAAQAEYEKVMKDSRATPLDRRRARQALRDAGVIA